MVDPSKLGTWVYVIVQDPGGKEMFLGQKHPEDQTAYIPVFDSKPIAEQGLQHLQRDTTLRYETQAILREDIIDQAIENGFVVYRLDSNGNVLEQWTEKTT